MLIPLCNYKVTDTLVFTRHYKAFASENARSFDSLSFVKTGILAARLLLHVANFA